MISKPSWMTTRLWQELLLRYDGIPRCDETGETENLSVDHINPRYFGGEDKADNLRFLAMRLNARKGTRPDRTRSSSMASSG
jgi:5-methylcytosine-specific restriction endonuclease McrA